MERARFLKLANDALEHIDATLGDLDHDALDVNLAGDVLNIAFADGASYIINAHSAAGQIWMAADKNAWHFDFDESSGKWIARKTGDELMATVSRTVGRRIGQAIEL